MNKFRSLIIGSVMAVMSIPVAFAAGTPSINITANESTQQSVSFNNISSDTKNLQVTINLSKNQNYSFLENNYLAGKAGVEFHCKTDNSTVTIYITSNTDVLTTSGNLILGTISADESFSIKSATNMKVTDGTNTSGTWDNTNTQTPSTDNGSDDNSDSNDSSNSGGNSGSNDSSNSGGNSGSNDSSNSDSSSSNNNNSNNSNDNSSNNNNNNSNTDKPETSIPFTDVSEKDWYYDAVKFAYDNGLMSGVSSTAFEPNANTTRGMIVTVMYRLENEPNVNIDNSFEDVKPSDYYGNAIYWAKQNNIVTGYNSTTFAPNDNITREQMAAILYRYASYKGYSVDKISDLSQFSDVSKINDYALKPIKWAVASNLISGIGDSTISPLGNASRAQIATILMRFIENL